MFSLPSEVVDHILTCLVLGNAIGPPANRFKSISPCTTVCKTLSLAARPHLFKNIRLWNEQHVSVLLDLIAVDSRIPSWIKEVTISTQSEAEDDVSTYLIAKQSVAAWLGLASRGGELMSRLQNVHTLRLEDISTDPDDEELAQVVAWTHLGRLQRVSRLVLERCEIPSWSLLISLLTETFPKLNNVSSLDVEVAPPCPLPDEPPIFEISGLTTFWMTGSLRHSAYSFVNRLRCVNLTRLALGAVMGRESNYPALLLSHAIHLERLEFVECKSWWGQGPIDLGSNLHLQHLAFHNIDNMATFTWIPLTISSLASPVQVKLIEVSGYLRSVPQELWSSLDATLSTAKFECNDGERRALMLNNLPSDNSMVDSLGNRTVEEIVPMTCGLGWFKVTNPSFVPDEPFRRRFIIDSTLMSTYFMYPVFPEVPLQDEEEDL